jgi:polyribonucleotide nucleotidyltransferase
MKNTSKENIEISNIIAKVLGVIFCNKEFSLGKWGEVDNYCTLSDNKLLMLECEKGQKHPNTNVLKLYPYLEQNPELNIIIIHYFYHENKAPKNRLALCDYLAQKITKEYKDRFQYISIRCEKNELENKIKEQKNAIIQQLIKKEISINEYIKEW